MSLQYLKYKSDLKCKSKWIFRKNLPIKSGRKKEGMHFCLVTRSFSAATSCILKFAILIQRQNKRITALGAVTLTRQMLSVSNSGCEILRGREVFVKLQSSLPQVL